MVDLHRETTQTDVETITCQFSDGYDFRDACEVEPEAQ